MSWTVNRRIAAGFAFLLLLVLVIGWVGYSASRTATEEYQEVLASQAQTYRASRVQNRFNDANLEFVRYLLSPDESWLQSRRELVEDLRRDLNANRVGSTGSQAREWSELATLLEQWEEASQQSIEAARDGRMAEAIRIRSERTLPLTERFAGTVDRIVEESEQRAEALRSAALRQAQRTETVLLVATLLALLAGSAIALFLGRSIARPLREASNSLASTAAELVASTAQQASGTAETTSAVTETAATVDEVAQTAEQAADRARRMASAAERASEISAAGQGAVDQSIESMEQIRRQVESIATSILALAEQAQAIGDIISTVDDLAGQTNLLALNAAIEASRAGEYGRGFTVVAGEIRSLADQSKKATVQVRQILGEIQRATGTAVMTTEEGTKQVARGSERIADAGETIRELSQTIAEASQTAAQIVASAGQQAIGMSQIRQAMRQIQEASQQNLSAVRQTEVAARDLNRLGGQLVELVGTGLRARAGG